ncbi:EAL domain-containing protein [Campylobacter hyointestinalis]|uniref:EAL domain-containing protein n=1 Tax=Campylobacter hyointestinalis TaxID=198 RepID=UPI002556C8B6|nr:EAL domain-containing protein [Campylobacter hyointestinalis]MDL2346492.1 EAL domain-containing protein [Campylobacter hyointestinalis]MDL2348231.1 EAL domain-containing protein [Campylobacter hyointestinalis]MDL2349977.1 EAL domain-containing protein [Campylobacter hyointestinalis]MDM1025346.1 EAL domain-containing protein [Campylobacter hyointestinalis]MDM1027986.1 EAL domain-containing protein [Campylobacter hyointestinalis]
MSSSDLLSYGLIKRAYLISVLSIVSIISLIIFIFFIKIDKIENNLKTLNLYYMSNIINKIDFINHDFSLLKDSKISTTKFKQIVDSHMFLKAVYILDRDSKIMQTYGDPEQRLDSFLIFDKKRKFRENGIFISRFVFDNDGNATVFMAIPSYEGTKILAQVDISKIVHSLSRTNDTFFIDSSGFLLPGGNGENIYDMLSLKNDLKSNDNYGISFDGEGGASFYCVHFNDILNIGIVSKKPFLDIFKENLAFFSLALIALVLFGLLAFDNFLFIREGFVKQIKNLKEMLEKLKIGEFYQSELSGAFKDIQENTIDIYLQELIAINDLRDYKEQYALIFQKSSINILFIDAKTAQIIDASSAAVEFYGYDKTHLLSMSFYKLQACNPYKHAHVQANSLYDSGNILCTHKMANGDLRKVQISTTPILTNLNSLYFMIVWDVTEHQLKLDNLRKEKQLLGLSPMLIVSFKLDEIWKVVQISNNVSDILGYNVEDVIFNDFGFKSIIHEEDIIPILRDVNHKVKLFGTYYEPDGEFERPCRILLKSKKYEWFKVYIKISKDSFDGIIATLFMFKNSRQKLLEDMYKEKINKYQNFLWASSAISFEYDCKSQTYHFSNNFFNLLEYKPEELGTIKFETLAKIIHQNDLDKFYKMQTKCINGDIDNLYLEIRFVSKYERIIWMAIKGKRLNSHQDIGNICGIIEDISKRIKTESQLKLIASVFSYSREAITITDMYANILDINDAFTQITGYSKEEVIGKNPNILSSNRHNVDFYVDMWKNIKKFGFWRGEIWNRRKNGDVYPEMLTISSVKNGDGEVQNYVGIFSDITQSKKNEVRLEQIAYFDPLTKLPNKFFVLEKLSKFMKEAKVNNKKLGLVYFDLDGFKQANDTYGHNISDAVLIKVSSRIKDVLKENLLARFGGDEFIALIKDIDDIENLKTIFDDILNSVNDDIIINDINIKVGVSIGATLYPQKEKINISGLIKQADWAMYKAKYFGKNRFYIFDEEKDFLFDYYNQMILSNNEFSHDEFILMYQPVANTKDKKIVSFEALIRWKHPQKGIMLPLDFLHVLKHKKWITDFSIWVIKFALSTIKDLGLKHTNISVNIPLKQLRDPLFFDKFKKLCSEYGDICHLLEIEVTDVPLSTSTTFDGIFKYKDLGINLVFDDFGLDTALIKTMKYIQADIYKINKDYALEILEDSANIEVLQNIYSVCKVFGKTPVIKGVSDERIYKIVSSIGFDNIQGNLISEPMREDEILPFMNNFEFKIAQSLNLKSDLCLFYAFEIASIYKLLFKNRNLNSFEGTDFEFEKYFKIHEEFATRYSEPLLDESKNLIADIYNSKDKDKNSHLISRLQEIRSDLLNKIDGDEI